MSRRWLYLTLSLAGVVLLAAAAVLLLARSERGHRLVVDSSISALEEALGAKVSVGRTSGTLLGSLVWSQVKIQRPDLDLAVDQLSFRIDYLALARKQVRITGLRAVGPLLRFKQPLVEPPSGAVAESDLPPAGGERPPAPPSPPPQAGEGAGEPKGGGWKISLVKAGLEGGRIEGLDLALGRPELGPVAEIQGRGDLTYQDNLQVKAQARALTQLNQRPVKVELTAGYDGRGIRAEEVILLFGPEARSRLELAGSSDLESLGSDLTFRTDLLPADLQAQLGSLLPPGSNLDLLEGKVRLKGSLKGNPERFTLAAQGDWEEAGLEISASLTTTDLSVEAQGRIKNLDPSRLSRFSGTRLPKGKAGLSFTAQGNLPDRLAGKMTLDEVVLEDYGRIQGGQAEAELAGRRIKGRVRLLQPAGFKAAAEVIEAQGEYGPEKASVQVTFQKLKGFKAVVDQGGFNLVYQDQRLDLSDLRLSEGRGSLTGQAQARLDQGGLTSGQALIELSEMTPPAGLLKDLLGLEAPLVDLASIKLSGPVEASFPGHELTLNLPGMRLDSIWGRIEGPILIKLSDLGEVKEFALDLDLSRFTVPGWVWPFLPPELKECILNGRLKVRGDQKSMIFEADLGGTSLAGQEIQELALKGSLTRPETVVLEKLRLGLLGAGLTASGPAWPQPALKVDLKGTKPDRLLAFLERLKLLPEPPPLKLAAYGVQGTLAGSPDRPSFKGRLKAQGLAWRKYAAPDLALDLDLEEVDLSAPAGTRGKARLKLAKLTGPDLAPLDLSLDLASAKTGGGFTGRLRVAGAGSRVESDLKADLAPEGRLSLAFPGLAVTLPQGRGQEVWRAAGPILVRLANGRPTGLEMALRGPRRQSFELKAELSKESIDLKARLGQVELTPWAAALGYDRFKSGRLDLTLDLGGELARPTLNLDGRVAGLVVLDRNLGDLSLQAELDKGRLGLKSEARRGQRSLAKVKAALGLTLGLDPWRLEPEPDSLAAELDLDGLDLAAWAAVLGQDRLERGLLSAHVELKGPVAEPLVRLQGRVQDLVVMGQSLGDLDLEGGLAQGLMIGRAEIRAGREPLASVRVKMGLRVEAKPWRLKTAPNGLEAGLKLNGLELPPWAVVLGYPQLTKGRLSSDLSVEGPAGSPRASLKGRLDGLHLGGREVGDLSFTAGLEGWLLSGRMEVLAGTETLARARGEVTLTNGREPWMYRPDPASLRAELDLERLDLARFDPALEALTGLSGTAQARIRLNPRPEGWVNLSGLGFTLAATGQEVSQGKVSLVILGDKVEVKELAAATGGGTLTGQGWLGLQGERPLDFKVDLSSALINFGSPGQGLISARLAVQETLAAPFASGQVLIEELKFRLPKAAPAESKEIVLVDEEPKGGRPPAPPDRLKLDLEIRMGDKTWIEGEGLKAQLGGGFHLVKAPADSVRAQGTLNIIQGYFARFGRRFTLQKGRVIFQNQPSPDPALDVWASVTVSQVDVNLNVTGTASKPQLALTSVPEMSRDDILAYLLFGRPASALTSGQSATLQAQGLGLLGGPATELVSGLVGDRLAPDTVSVSPSAEGGLAVETGKQVLPNLYISYIAFSEASKPNEFHIEYRVTPNISVQSSVGDRNTTGVDVNFRFDF